MFASGVEKSNLGSGAKQIQPTRSKELLRGPRLRLFRQMQTRLQVRASGARGHGKNSGDPEGRDTQMSAGRGVPGGFIQQSPLF